MFRSLLLGLLAAGAAGVGGVTVTEYSDPGCTTLSPAGSQGPQSPFTVNSGSCVPFLAGSSYGYFQVTCDSVFYQLGVWGASGTICSGTASRSTMGTSGQCVKLSSSSWVKVDCGPAPPAGKVILKAFSDSGCGVPENVASSGVMGPVTTDNGACSPLTVASGNVYLTATVYGPIFSLAMWGSSGANCAGAADTTFMGAAGVCTPMPNGNTYVMVTSSSGGWSGSGSSGTVSEYSDNNCQVLAPGGSNGPFSPFNYNNGACQQYQAGSTIGYYSLTAACSMYVLNVYGSSATNCAGAPAYTDVGVSGSCSALTSPVAGPTLYPGGPSYNPAASWVSVKVNPSAGSCPNAAAQAYQGIITQITALATVVITAILTKLVM